MHSHLQCWEDKMLIQLRLRHLEGDRTRLQCRGNSYLGWGSSDHHWHWSRVVRTTHPCLSQNDSFRLFLERLSVFSSSQTSCQCYLRPWLQCYLSWESVWISYHFCRQCSASCWSPWTCSCRWSWGSPSAQSRRSWQEWSLCRWTLTK